jgi:hypothetical protein
MPRPRGVLVLAALLVLALAPSATAIELAGRDLVIPVAGRTPGAGGTFWETDLVLTNLSPDYPQLRATVDTWIGGELLTFDVAIPAMGTVTIEDFLQTRFGRDGIGIVRISSTPADAQLVARARVHTTGDVGQSVSALPMSALTKDSIIPGLPGTAGNRSNLGVANPNDVATDVLLELLGPEGQQLATRHVQVGAHSVLQQEIGAAFQPHLVAQRDVSVRVTATQPVYSYGSVVRTSTGDASFVLGTAYRKSSDFSVTPQCTEPAALIFNPGSRPGWLITYKTGTETKTVTPALAAKYGFTPLYTLGVFVVANLTPEMIAGLRCEAPVRTISQGSHVSLGD